MENRKDNDTVDVTGRRKPYLPGVPTPRWLPGGGIPADEIPEGDEDLYILKSKIVPPVCPKCPDTRACPRQNLVHQVNHAVDAPNHLRMQKSSNHNVLNTSSYPSSNNNNVESILPKPMLNSFSTFA